MPCPNPQQVQVPKNRANIKITWATNLPNQPLALRITCLALNHPQASGLLLIEGHPKSGLDLINGKSCFRITFIRLTFTTAIFHLNSF